MDVLIYTRAQYCKFCEAAKSLLADYDIDYDEMVVGVDISREEFIEEFPTQKTVPLIFINGDKIGGYEDLKEYLENTSGGYGEDAI